MLPPAFCVPQVKAWEQVLAVVAQLAQALAQGPAAQALAVVLGQLLLPGALGLLQRLG
jgi:hypothetical protein